MANHSFNPLFFPDIKQAQKELRTPFLGISIGEVPDEYLSETVKKGGAVYIDHVMAEAAAERAGIITGDIIIALDGKPFDNKDGNLRKQLQKFIKKKSIGDSLQISIIRNGEPVAIEAKIGERKKIPAGVKSHPEIDAIQKSMGKVDSVIYRTVQRKGRLEDFLKVMARLKEKSFVLDSYKVAPDNPFRLSEINYILQNPTDIIPVSREITKSFLTHLNAEVYDMGGLIREASLMLDVEFFLDADNVPTISSIDDIIRYVVEITTRAEHYRKAAFKELSEEEIQFLEEEALRLLSGEDEVPEMYERLLKVAKKVDYRMLFKSMAEISRIVSFEVIQALKDIETEGLKRESDVPADLVSGDVIDIIETRFGRIIVGGSGRTYYKDNVFMIIDFGGNDLYENDAGVSTAGHPFGIVIDLGGSDKYISKGNLSQGTGFMGTGILTDVTGDDIYISESFSHGSGIFGGGVLLDLDGDDRYVADFHAEGAGSFGIGIFLDVKGNDTYEARKLSQGFAFIKGLGMLADLSGNDLYVAAGKYPDHRDTEHATQSLSQGFAIGIRPYDSPVGASGGIGVLIDKEGNDKYIGDYFSQGSSYWYALGILHDMNGDDTYIAGRYAQGAGIHVSAGSLIDETGDDSYIITSGASQGMGHDFGIGVLADFHGNDIYKGGDLSQGAVTCGSIGILYDEDGQDSYFADEVVEDLDNPCRVRGFGALINGER